MLKAKDVALYFLQLDKDGSVFTDREMTDKNGNKVCEGNVRLNIYLQLAQNIFYAKTGRLLFEDKLYACDD